MPEVIWCLSLDISRFHSEWTWNAVKTCLPSNPETNPVNNLSCFKQTAPVYRFINIRCSALKIVLSSPKCHGGSWANIKWVMGKIPSVYSKLVFMGRNPLDSKTRRRYKHNLSRSKTRRQYKHKEQLNPHLDFFFSERMRWLPENKAPEIEETASSLGCQ